MSSDVVAAVWRELQALRPEAEEGGELDALLRFAGLVIGEEASRRELEASAPALRRAAMMAVARVVAPRGGLEEQAFRVVAEHDALDVDDLYLAVWAGATPREAGWEQLSLQARAAALTTLVRAGVPASAAGLLEFAQAQIDEADRDALVSAWCAHRAFERSGEEYRLIAELAPGPRLEAMAQVLARVGVSPLVAQTWAFDADAGWRLAVSEAEHAFADARVGAIAVAAGAREEGEAMVRHALGLATRLSDPGRAAAAYGVVLGASASIGVGPWLAVVETLTNDRRLLRSRRAFLAARAAAVRTLARVALTHEGAADLESALDRGHAALKEAARRVPERWLELLLRTTMAALLSRLQGRSIAVQLADVGDWLRQGEPEPIAEITLEECLGQLVLAAPEEVVPLSRRIVSGVGGGREAIGARARWLAGALACLCG